MKRQHVLWEIKDLQEKFDEIEFPEFQREPSVWDLNRKRQLIDSILRNFDISIIYLYKKDGDTYECIDGKQRINAIMSFLGLNEWSDEKQGPELHNKFVFKSTDELMGNSILEAYNNKTWDQLSLAQQKPFLDYKINVLEITGIDDDNEEELNLMFLRLQLGVPLKGGEKLNAMVGDMRDFIFKSSQKVPSLGEHPYFEYMRIPKRRFSKALTASQIAINFFALHKGEEYKRARFVDLQEFFKIYQKFHVDDKKIAVLLRKRLGEVYTYLTDNTSIELRNRAIGVSVFFLINGLIEKKENNQINSFLQFLNLFLKRLKEQVEKGFEIEPQYRDLLKFQTYISQAAVEKNAIENRERFLLDYFDYYGKNNKKIKGDK